MANGSCPSDFNGCSLTCFDDVLFHSKVAIEDEAEVADDSSKHSIGIAKRNKQFQFYDSLFSLSLLSWISPVSKLVSVHLKKKKVV